MINVAQQAHQRNGKSQLWPSVKQDHPINSHEFVHVGLRQESVEHARRVPIEDAIKRRGIDLKRQGAELVGPCPVCGGDEFGDLSVELDAIDPDRLRSLVADAIEVHLPRQRFALLKAAEESEREALRMLVGGAA